MTVSELRDKIVYDVGNIGYARIEELIYDGCLAVQSKAKDYRYWFERGDYVSTDVVYMGYPLGRIEVNDALVIRKIILNDGEARYTDNVYEALVNGYLGATVKIGMFFVEGVYVYFSPRQSSVEVEYVRVPKRGEVDVPSQYLDMLYQEILGRLKKNEN